jgi:hypothetical protein
MSGRLSLLKKLLLSCFALFFFSCTDFFTTSLASWAKRDPSSLIPPVTTGNVKELIELTESDPDMSLALLKNIDSAGANPDLQAAALQVAANASGLGTAILQHTDDINNINENNAKDIVIDALNGLSNVAETGTVLGQILPDPSSTEPADIAAWDNFVAASSAEDLAMAAAVLLAAEAKNAPKGASDYIEDFDPTTPATPTEKLAISLATAAKDKPSTGGFLEDLLKGLNLIT